MMSRYDQLWFGFTVLASVVSLVYLLKQVAAARRNRPVFTKADIVYQEWMASGNSEANLLTKMGAASNCLRLIVTSDYLIVTSWFPFLLFAAFYDLEHAIPLSAIQSIEKKRVLFLTGGLLTLTYRDTNGRNRRINLKPSNQKRFLQAMKPTSEHDNKASYAFSITGQNKL